MSLVNVRVKSPVNLESLADDVATPRATRIFPNAPPNRKQLRIERRPEEAPATAEAATWRTAGSLNRPDRFGL